MRTNRVLVIEPAESFKRLQGAKEFFIENLDDLLHQQHRAILEDLMLYERQCFLNAHPLYVSPHAIFISSPLG